MKKAKEQPVRMYKQLAQALGFLVSAFFMLFLLGEGLPDISRGHGSDLLPMLPLWLLPVIGYALSWYRELPGIWLIILGAISWMLYYFIHQEPGMALAFGLPYLATAALFILHLRKQRALQHKHR